MHKEALAKFRKLKKGPVTITYKHRIRSRPQRFVVIETCIPLNDFYMFDCLYVNY